MAIQLFKEWYLEKPVPPYTLENLTLDDIVIHLAKTHTFSFTIPQRVVYTTTGNKIEIDYDDKVAVHTLSAAILSIKKLLVLGYSSNIVAKDCTGNITYQELYTYLEKVPVQLSAIVDGNSYFLYHSYITNTIISSASVSTSTIYTLSNSADFTLSPYGLYLLLAQRAKCTLGNAKNLALARLEAIDENSIQDPLVYAMYLAPTYDVYSRYSGLTPKIALRSTIEATREHLLNQAPTK